MSDLQTGEFVSLKTLTNRGRTPSGGPLTVSITKNKAGKPSLRFSVSGDVAKALGLADKAKADVAMKLDTLEGRIKADTAGYSYHVKEGNRGWLTVAMKDGLGIPDDYRGPIKVERAEVKDGALFFKIAKPTPEEIKAAAAKEAAAKAAAAANPATPAAPVTAAA